MHKMVELARRAEQAGIDSIYLTEAWRSGFVGLAATPTRLGNKSVTHCVI
ncbi:MAG: hypothetical protein OXP09_14240 [Gammaproteobacteria bacterium]|nr:hypothetical protein [Gammaproteobacteria bacterium]